MKNDKLELDLSFLDSKENKDVGATTPEKIENHKSVSAIPKLKEYIQLYLHNYIEFAKKCLTYDKPPYLFYVIWLSGAASVADRMEGNSNELGSWVTAWIIILVAGILSGYFQYWIGGAIYHLFVKLAKGQDNPALSRNLYLYSGLPTAVTTLSVLLLNTLAYGDKYFTPGGGSSLGIIFLLIVLCAMGYSIYLGYKGVVHVQNANPKRAAIIFVILPTIFYLLVFLSSLSS